MCNSLQNGSRVYKIPEYGFGYKVFTRGKMGASGIQSPHKGAVFIKGEWVVWDAEEAYPFGGEGFCFLYTKQDVLDYYPTGEDVVHRIRYRKGLGRRRQGFSYMSSLCKEFKILKEVDIREIVKDLRLKAGWSSEEALLKPVKGR